MTERELMLTSILNCRPVDLIAYPQALSLTQKECLLDLETRRAAGEPLQYLFGSCDFMGIELAVDPRALIPRPETEILVEKVLEYTRDFGHRQGIRVLDIGTGTGNIAIAVAKNNPGCSVTAIDVSGGALDLARTNAHSNTVTSQIKFIQVDVDEFWATAAQSGECFDVILSNPPYIPTGQLSHLPLDVQREPLLALDGGATGLKFYEKIIPNAFRILRPGGYIFLEIGDQQGLPVTEIFSKSADYEILELTKDYAGADRVVCAQRMVLSKLL